MLEIKNLHTVFESSDAVVHAVDGVSFSVPDGSTVGIVGESGSGKSVTAASIMRLLPSNARLTEGEILWKGKDLVRASEQDMRAIRGREIGLIFQNPQASLNPVFTIGTHMMETILLHHKVTKEKAREMALSWLQKVNISDPEKRMDQYPHECSLGMCQRIMIALTLAMSPSLLIADEPTASLDVTIQAQILHLLNDLQRDLGMSVLLISHDLGVVAQHCDSIVVMYLGRVMEYGPTKDVFANPRHPYTRALLASIPIADPTKKQDLVILKGETPSPIHLPTGCRFHPRCPEARPECQTTVPTPLMGGAQLVDCLFAADSTNYNRNNP